MACDLDGRSHYGRNSHIDRAVCSHLCGDSCPSDARYGRRRTGEARGRGHDPHLCCYIGCFQDVCPYFRSDYCRDIPGDPHFVCRDPGDVPLPYALLYWCFRSQTILLQGFRACGRGQRAFRSVRGCRPLSAENSITWSFPGAPSPLETFGRQPAEWNGCSKTALEERSPSAGEGFG